MKYPMTKNTDRPMFEYLVRQNSEYDYFLYADFDSALKKAIELSTGIEIGLVYEVFFNTNLRDYRGQNTFIVSDGKIEYNKHAKVDLHIEFYINAGEWLNPNKEWIEILTHTAGEGR